jgi:hypothetical protein
MFHILGFFFFSFWNSCINYRLNIPNLNIQNASVSKSSNASMTQDVSYFEAFQVFRLRILKLTCQSNLFNIWTFLWNCKRCLNCFCCKALTPYMSPQTNSRRLGIPASTLFGFQQRQDWLIMPLWQGNKTTSKEHHSLVWQTTLQMNTITHI